MSVLTKKPFALRREQIDRALSHTFGLQHPPQPKRGWIRDAREILGLSAQQLAMRMGVSQPTVAKMEQSEIRGSITLASLRKAAEAMNCRFVYAFVPQTSFEDVLRNRAMEAASRLLGRVDHTMALEAQEPDESFRARRVQELADELVRTLSRELWQEGENQESENQESENQEGKEQKGKEQKGSGE